MKTPAVAAALLTAGAAVVVLASPLPTLLPDGSQSVSLGESPATPDDIINLGVLEAGLEGDNSLNDALSSYNSWRHKMLPQDDQHMSIINYMISQGLFKDTSNENWYKDNAITSPSIDDMDMDMDMDNEADNEETGDEELNVGDDFYNYGGNNDMSTLAFYDADVAQQDSQPLSDLLDVDLTNVRNLPSDYFDKIIEDLERPILEADEYINKFFDLSNYPEYSPVETVEDGIAVINSYYVDSYAQYGGDSNDFVLFESDYEGADTGADTGAYTGTDVGADTNADEGHIVHEYVSDATNEDAEEDFAPLDDENVPSRMYKYLPIASYDIDGKNDPRRNEVEPLTEEEYKEKMSVLNDIFNFVKA